MAGNKKKKENALEGLLLPIMELKKRKYMVKNNIKRIVYYHGNNIIKKNNINPSTSFSIGDVKSESAVAFIVTLPNPVI